MKLPLQHKPSGFSTGRTDSDSTGSRSVDNGNEPTSLQPTEVYNDEEHGLDDSYESDGDDDESNSNSNLDGSRRNGSGGVIAARETQMVNCSKTLVLMVVSLLAAVCGLAVFFYVQDAEAQSYRTSFDTVVQELTATVNLRSLAIMDNLKTISVSLTTQATMAGMEFPFVVFPDFQVTGILSCQVTGASTLTWNPFVTREQRQAWEEFTTSPETLTWLDRAHNFDEHVHPDLYQDVRDSPTNDYYTNRNKNPNVPAAPRTAWNESGITPYIWIHDQDMNRVPDHTNHDTYYPIWQRAPAEDYLPTINLNFAEKVDGFGVAIELMRDTDQPVMTATADLPHLAWNYDRRFDYNTDGPPHSYLLQPIYDSLLEDRKMVAFLGANMGWEPFLRGSLPKYETHGVLLVMDGTCGNQVMSFEIAGQDAVFLGDSDLHDPRFDEMEQTIQLDVIGTNTADDNGNSTACRYSARLYPTQAWADQYFTDMPMVYAVLVITCFLITTLLFAFYDFAVRMRQKKVMETAAKTNAIVSSLFPSNVRDRLMQEIDQPIQNDQKMMKALKKDNHGEKMELVHPNNGRRNSGPRDQSSHHGDFSSNELVATSEAIFGSKPIADLFPNTTIMFADMVGFTAWSSSRDPTQVFTLLETIYHSFDTIAKKRRVFKVETIGDCYVAVAGLPHARKDHALVMARFATDCLTTMNVLTSQLEKSLGPDTNDLSLRIGLHSGPVTAGVLRGEKGRFQLFGDTMNTASRMETTGASSRIQVSQQTADLLIGDGKSKWVVPRAERVQVKGKGELQTYWLRLNSASRSNSFASLVLEDNSEIMGSSGGDRLDGSVRSNRSLNLLMGQTEVKSKTQRLVDYNVDILTKLLHQIVVRRYSNPPKMVTRNQRKSIKAPIGTPLDEVKDILSLPQFDANTFKKHIDPDTISISPRVLEQLQLYVTMIADLYPENSFHNFEHASHVTQSVTKLLGRIVSPDVGSSGTEKQHTLAATLHDHTFGITSDPLTHFACVLSALIHDADHPGVSNDVLCKENDPLAVKYAGKSVAEQNSVELCWNLLMESKFDDLRSCIYCNEDEFKRFRQVIINIVLATDIMDKELGAQRRARWELAFKKGSSGDLTQLLNDNHHDTKQSITTNRKATIVLEHLIQASDVAHTMQHWHVYQKWNERLFHEIYTAYKAGRVDKDPSEGWYKGEIGFFDFYIIPLAKKLETCGVFGVSSDEYLNYATQNRLEWVAKGEEIVQGYLKQYQDQPGLQ